MMNFRFSINDLNTVSDEGFPENGELCFVLFEDKDGDYDCFVGIYSEEKNHFYANYGENDVIVKGKNVVAWKEFNVETVNIKKIKH